jgi:hypothetical protein
MMFLKQIALASTALLASTAAWAQIGVTADLGSTGAGFHLVVPMESDLNGRFGINYLKHDFSKNSSGIDYDVKGKLQTFDLLFDWYALGGAKFHLTAGLVYNGNRFDAVGKADPLGGYKLNNDSYTAADVGVLSGRVEYRKAAPYLGVGWGNALAQGSRWKLNADLGAFYQGGANVKLTSIGCTTSQLVCEALAGDVAAVRQRFGDDLDKFKVYPVLRASLSYRF